jgi:hypothetical protein
VLIAMSIAWGYPTFVFADEPSISDSAAAASLELRQAEEDRNANREWVYLLQRALDDPTVLAAARRATLEDHPTLQRLHAQWWDVHQQRTQLLDTLLPAHPKAQACLAAEEQALAPLRRELHAALEAAQAKHLELDAQLSVIAQRAAECAALPARDEERQRQPLDQQDQNADDLAAEEDQPLADLQVRTEALARAEQALTSAQASLIATHEARSGIHVGQQPVLGTPARVFGVTTGLLAGGIVGLALVLLTARMVRTGEPPRNAAIAVPQAPNDAAAPTCVDTARPPAPVMALFPSASPASPAVTVPVSAAAPAPRPSTVPRPTSVSRPRHPAGHMTLKDALIRCAETTGHGLR